MKCRRCCQLLPILDESHPKICGFESAAAVNALSIDDVAASLELVSPCYVCHPAICRYLGLVGAVRAGVVAQVGDSVECTAVVIASCKRNMIDIIAIDVIPYQIDVISGCSNHLVHRLGVALAYVVRASKSSS